MQWFVVGHDCGHRAFCKNKLVEDIVGTLLFMPLIFPFEPWRIKHNQHHAHTNKCVVVGISDRPALLPTAPCPMRHCQQCQWTPDAAVCRLVEDTAWHPVQKAVMDKWSPVERFLYTTFLGSPLKLWASVGHWWIWHFDLNK